MAGKRRHAANAVANLSSRSTEIKQGYLDALGKAGFSVCYARRDTKLIGENWADKKPSGGNNRLSCGSPKAGGIRGRANGKTRLLRPAANVSEFISAQNLSFSD